MTRARRAKEHMCSCGRQAREWSYIANLDNEQRGMITGTDSPVRWSGDPADYAPECVACHRRRDAEQRRIDRIDYFKVLEARSFEWA